MKVNKKMFNLIEHFHRNTIQERFIQTHIKLKENLPIVTPPGNSSAASYMCPKALKNSNSVSALPKSDGGRGETISWGTGRSYKNYFRKYAFFLQQKQTNL